MPELTLEELVAQRAEEQTTRAIAPAARHTTRPQGEMPELTPQDQARQIADLAGWQLREAEFLQVLREIGLSDQEAHFCMTSEVV